MTPCVITVLQNANVVSDSIFLSVTNSVYTFLNNLDFCMHASFQVYLLTTFLIEITTAFKN